MSSKSWLEAIKQSDGTISTTEPRRRPAHRLPTNTGGFLQGLEPMDRNALLELHESHCKRIKYNVMLAGYREEVRRKDEEARIALSLQQKQDSPRHSSIISSNAYAYDEEVDSSISSITSTTASSYSSGVPRNTDLAAADEQIVVVQASNNKTKKKRKQSHNMMMTSGVIRLNEPDILRMSIYKKLAIHLQHFYNEQDVLSIESLILYPMCQPTVMKTLFFWESDHGIESNNKSVMLPSSSLVLSKSRKLSLLRTITVQGSQGIADACAHIFETLPDCVIVYHAANADVIDREDADSFGKVDKQNLQLVENSMGFDVHSDASSISSNLSTAVHQSMSSCSGVTVRVPYSYFFQMPSSIVTSSSVEETTEEDQAAQDDNITPNAVASAASSIEVELNGCVELFFGRDSNHSIAQIFDHVTLASCRTDVTMEQVMQYMNYS